MSALVTVVGLLVALGGFEAASKLQTALDRPDEGLEAHVWKWLVPAAVVAYVLVVESQSLASIGWTFPEPSSFAAVTAVGVVGMLAANVAFQPLWTRLGTNDDILEGVASFADLSMPGRLFVAGTAGVTEEVPYRGYTVERVAALAGSPLLGASVSLAAFLTVHIGDTWSPRAAVQMVQPTVRLLALYLWTRSLPVVIVVHALYDAVGLLLAGRVAESVEEAPA